MPSSTEERAGVTVDPSSSEVDQHRSDGKLLTTAGVVGAASAILTGLLIR